MGLCQVIIVHDIELLNNIAILQSRSGTERLNVEWRKASTEHTGVFLSLNICNRATDIRFTPDVSRNPRNPHNTKKNNFPKCSGVESSASPFNAL